MTRFLLTGAGGQLGRELTAAANSADVELVALTRRDLDVTDAAQVRDVVKSSKPDVILHTAAYTAVDDCESAPDVAYAINGTGTENVVAAADESGSRVAYISTDYVFDGSKPEPYLEDDAPNPVSVYGLSKLRGERAVEALGASGLIVRTSWVCGAHGSNMVKTILRAAENHPILTFVDDQIGKPTFTSDLAPVLLRLAIEGHHGVMHVTNEGSVSWFEFCREVLQAAGLDSGRVRPCATHELQPPRPAPRPPNSVLDNTRFVELRLPLLRDFREPLGELVRDLTS